MKDNVLGVLTWWMTARRVSLSPGLSDKPWSAHPMALELTSLDASWITTTLWASMVMIDRLILFKLSPIKRKRKQMHSKNIYVLWLSKKCFVSENEQTYSAGLREENCWRDHVKMNVWEHKKGDRASGGGGIQDST
jgi:hypothetical protein